MRYEITEGGIHFFDTEPPQEQPITNAEVMATIHRISADIEALDDCECVRQGLRPCGTCDVPPIRPDGK